MKYGLLAKSLVIYFYFYGYVLKLIPVVERERVHMIENVFLVDNLGLILAFLGGLISLVMMLCCYFLFCFFSPWYFSSSISFLHFTSSSFIWNIKVLKHLLLQSFFFASQTFHKFSRTCFSNSLLLKKKPA